MLQKKMRVGPSMSASRGRHQTRQCGWSLKVDLTRLCAFMHRRVYSEPGTMHSLAVGLLTSPCV